MLQTGSVLRVILVAEVVSCKEKKNMTEIICSLSFSFLVSSPIKVTVCPEPYTGSLGVR